MGGMGRLIRVAVIRAAVVIILVRDCLSNQLSYVTVYLSQCVVVSVAVAVA